MTGGDVVLTVRGFGVVHHGLQMPPASDSMLAPIIDREVRRLEPELLDPVVGWIALPSSSRETADDETPQRMILSAAVPAAIVKMFDERLTAAGYRLAHFTALPAAMQRLVEDFEQSGDSTALVAPLPDGAFLGFCMNGGLRLIVEPPFPDGAEHDAAALAEEIELGTILMRQQFQGAHVDRLVVVGSDPQLGDVETALAERVHAPARRLGVLSLSPAALAALGGIVDSQSPKPLALGGASRKRADARPRSAIDGLATTAVILLFLVGAWTIVQAVRTRQLGVALQTARRDIEQDSFGLAALQSTADQRRMTRDAVAAVRYVANDKVRLQALLGEISTTISPPVRLDSVHLARGVSGWKTIVGGSVSAESNARAVQALHDLYRELPSRLSADSLKLDQLAYSDSTRDGNPLVRFQLSFAVPAARLK
jgi:hypothetical protein